MTHDLLSDLRIDFAGQVRIERATQRVKIRAPALRIHKRDSRRFQVLSHHPHARNVLPLENRIIVPRIDWPQVRQCFGQLRVQTNLRLVVILGRSGPSGDEGQLPVQVNVSPLERAQFRPSQPREERGQVADPARTCDRQEPVQLVECRGAPNTHLLSLGLNPRYMGQGIAGAALMPLHPFQKRRGRILVILQRFRRLRLTGSPRLKRIGRDVAERLPGAFFEQLRQPLFQVVGIHPVPALRAQIRNEIIKVLFERSLHAFANGARCNDAFLLLLQFTQKLIGSFVGNLLIGGSE